jgi:hypothetical protein
VAFTYQQIIEAEWQDLQAEHAAANAELEYARVAEDPHAVKAATNRLYDIDNRTRSLSERVQQMQRQPQAMPGAEGMSSRDVALAKHYGLSAGDLSIAKNWTNDSNLTDEAKVRTYVENRQRYRQARADGSYRDDQGTVTR